MATKKPESIVVERHAYPELVLYEITGEELDQLDKEASSISEDFSFGLFGLSVAASFSIALLTTKIEVERVFNSFLIVTLLGYGAAIFFGFRWFIGRARHKGIVRRIKERIGPLGDETKQLSPSELAALPAQETPTQQRNTK